jgi:hypothetical protein
MTYDAVLAARRGLGVEEQRLAPSALLEAIYWARYAEAQAPRLADLREVVAIDPPDGLTGADRSTFMQNRTLARTELAALEAYLYPADEELPA